MANSPETEVAPETVCAFQPCELDSAAWERVTDTRVSQLFEELRGAVQVVHYDLGTTLWTAILRPKCKFAASADAFKLFCCYWRALRTLDVQLVAESSRLTPMQVHELMSHHVVIYPIGHLSANSMCLRMLDHRDSPALTSYLLSLITWIEGQITLYERALWECTQMPFRVELPPNPVIRRL